VVDVEGLSQGLRRIYRKVVSLPEAAADHQALGRLWARARIHRLERDLDGGTNPQGVESITSLGLRYHLMTPYTSLVAVDSEIATWPGVSTPVRVPVEMPEDVSYEGVFGIKGKLRSLGYLGNPIAALNSTSSATNGPAPAPAVGTSPLRAKTRLI